MERRDDNDTRVEEWIEQNFSMLTRPAKKTKKEKNRPPPLLLSSNNSKPIMSSTADVAESVPIPPPTPAPNAMLHGPMLMVCPWWRRRQRVLQRQQHDRHHRRCQYAKNGIWRRRCSSVYLSAWRSQWPWIDRIHQRHDYSFPFWSDTYWPYEGCEQLRFWTFINLRPRSAIILKNQKGSYLCHVLTDLY